MQTARAIVKLPRKDFELLEVPESAISTEIEKILGDCEREVQRLGGKWDDGCYYLVIQDLSNQPASALIKHGGYQKLLYGAAVIYKTEFNKIVGLSDEDIKAVADSITPLGMFDISVFHQKMNCI